MSDRWDLELSCMVDGASELQAQRSLLDACRGDAEITARWARYHTIGALMRGEASSGGMDLTGRIAAAIATDPTFKRRRGNVLHFSPPMKRASIGLALAASFATATVIGVRIFSPAVPSGMPVASLAGNPGAPSAGASRSPDSARGDMEVAGGRGSDVAPVWAVPGGAESSALQPAAVLMQPGAFPDPEAREELLERRVSGAAVGAPDDFAEYLSQHREYSFLGTVPVDLVSGELGLDAPVPEPR